MEEVADGVTVFATDLLPAGLRAEQVNTADINEINRMLKRFGCLVPIEMVQIKYLNNMIEHDHCMTKKRIRPTLGGIEVANMIR